MGDEGISGALMVASNITPDKETGIGRWTDGEKIRAIREGISRDGRVLFPLMPFTEFRNMSDFDTESLVAYLDTLPPIKNSLPQTQLPRPVALMIRSLPKPVAHVDAPSRGDSLRYGEYLVSLGQCRICHTQEDKGQLKRDLLFAGGRKFVLPFGTVVSSNITPDQTTGIGRWSETFFKIRFADYRKDLAQSRKVQADEFTLMPWLAFSQLEPDDVSAIYAYLRAQRPIVNKVKVHPPVATTARS